MNILIIGRGGREHALAYKFSLEDRVNKVFVYPGNPGMQKTKKVESLHLFNETQFFNFIQTHEIKFALIGPEEFIINGMADNLRSNGLPVIAPTVAAAMLESSKIFSKKIMIDNSIPTAKAYECHSSDEAIELLGNFSSNVVLKLSGLHAGKGVFVADKKEDAIKQIKEWENIISEGLLIEERLIGYEVSMFYLCKNNSAVFLGEASDHKRIFDGDLGPNTGGMGCFSPNPNLTDKERNEVYTNFVKPTLKGMSSLNTPFEGILFLGLMFTVNGPKLLEYNVRFGDPETQTFLPLIDNGFLDVCLDFINPNVTSFDESTHKITFSSKKSVHVVKASAGYPENPKVGEKIHLENSLETLYFFSGVKSLDGQLITSGGRVCGLTTVAHSFLEARSLCYENLKQVTFKGEQMRSDIGAKAL